MNEAAKTLNEQASRAADRARHAASDLGEEAYGRLEKDMAAVKTEIARLSEELGGAVASFGAVAQSRARRGLKAARARADEFASDASARAGAAGAALDIVARDTASSVGDTLSEAVEARPLMALAAAVGIGFLIGAAWRR